jgi:hypothetical protein
MDRIGLLVQHSLLAHRRARSARRRAVRGPSLHWQSPEPHLWVATGGEYAGMTEYDRRTGYTATGPRAERIGRFRSLDDAKAALETAGPTPAP